MAQTGQPEMASPTPEIVAADNKIRDVTEQHPEDLKPDAPHDPAGDTGGLAGIEKIQATTQVWSKPWLITAYIRYNRPSSR